MSYTFRTAETTDDFQQIHQLNHQIFSGELGQYATRADGLLPDRFEARSRYLMTSRIGRSPSASPIQPS